MPKVVLAYSGGLDTSVAVRWLKEERNLDVLTFSANLGQQIDLEAVAEKSLETGAKSAHVGDLRERFVDDYIWPTVRAGALYGEGYPLATALGRPLIVEELVSLAEENGAAFVAHGCTGKGNDQVRFETAVAGLAPHLKVIAPLREWHMKTRDDEIDYARRYNIPIEVTKEKPYSYDRNLWGLSVECGELEDPWNRPPEDAYEMTASPESAPDQAETIVLGFEEGIPVTLDGERLGGVELIEKLNETGGRHGVGRLDCVEDRVVGIKSREVYEAPGATIVHAGRSAIANLACSKEVLRVSENLSALYGQLIYEGLWFSDIRRALDEFYRKANEVVTGEVRMRLYKGSVVVEGRRSPESLYDLKLASYGEEDAFDHEASTGFVKIWSLPRMVEAIRARRSEGN